MYKSGQNRILIAMVVWLYQIFDAEPLMGVDNRSSLVSDEDFGQVDQDDSSKRMFAFITLYVTFPA